MADFSRATGKETDVTQAIDDAFENHKWNEEQISKGGLVKDAIKKAVAAAIEHVPASADRTSGIRKLREAQYDFSAAITHDGKH